MDALIEITLTLLVFGSYLGIGALLWWFGVGYGIESEKQRQRHLTKYSVDAWEKLTDGLKKKLHNAIHGARLHMHTVWEKQNKLIIIGDECKRNREQRDSKAAELIIVKHERDSLAKTLAEAKQDRIDELSVVEQRLATAEKERDELKECMGYVEGHIKIMSKKRNDIRGFLYDMECATDELNGHVWEHFPVSETKDASIPF